MYCVYIIYVYRHVYVHNILYTFRNCQHLHILKLKQTCLCNISTGIRDPKYIVKDIFCGADTAHLKLFICNQVIDNSTMCSVTL